jgi:hypothetical protein
MSLTVKYEDRQDYLYAFVEGEYDFKSTVESYTGILETGAKRRATRVVIDARTAAGGPSVLERYEIVTAVVNKYYDLIKTPGYVLCRFAMVGQAPDMYGPVNPQVLRCWPFQGPARQSPDFRSAANSDG